MGQEQDTAWGALEEQLRSQCVVRMDVIPGGGWVIHDALGRQGAGSNVRESLEDLRARTKED